MNNILPHTANTFANDLRKLVVNFDIFCYVFCKIFRIFKPSDALKMFSTIEADFQTDWNKCPENGGKSSRGLPEITKVNLWNSKRQKNIWYKFSVKDVGEAAMFFKKTTIDFFWLGWVDWNRWRANNRPSGGDHQMGEGYSFLVENGWI